MPTASNLRAFGRGSRLALPRLAGAAALLLSVAACDTSSLLQVDDPDVTRPEALFDPSNLPALRASVISDFTTAFSGTGSTTVNIGLIHTTGLMSDELWHSGTFGQNREFDRRTVGETNSFLASVTRNLYRARTLALIGTESFEQNNPGTAQHAEMWNLLGYVYLFFAENYCSGVPFSRDVGGAFQYGQPQTTQQIRQQATEAFQRAEQIATAAAVPGAPAAALTAAVTQQRLARMGRARVLLGQNDPAGAAALVAQIPTGWSYAVQHSENTPRQNNGLWANNWGRREISISANEGGSPANFRPGTATAVNAVVAADPRLPWRAVNGAADSRSVHFFQHRYPTQGAAVDLASGIEARLIQAEAALNRGASATYLAFLNPLRADAGLPDLTDPGTANGRVTQFFNERGAWLFGSAQRLNDLRRQVRQYGRPVGSVFPNGVYIRPGTTTPSSATGEWIPRQDGTYGTDVNFPLPFDEQNNPNFDQCIDRDP